jgi:signal transduction histidine kinase
MRILLVEDSRTAVRLVEGLLSEESETRGFRFELTVAGTLKDALAKIATYEFELILLDLTLPDSDGLNTVDAVVRASPDVAVVVLTSLQEEKMGLKALKMGAQDFLVKDETYRRSLIRAVRYAHLRKQSEVEVREAKELAEFATRSKSDFIANLSHEFRTPLNAIMGFSEMMIARMHGELNDKYAEYALDINNSGKYLNGLIGTVLDMSKIEARKIEFSDEVIDLDASLAAVISKTRFLADDKGVSISYVPAHKMPIIHGDEIKLKQVFINLMSNAIKFSPDGGVVTLSVAMDDSGSVVLVFEDHGIGIPADELNEVLTPFHRSRLSKDMEIEGTGLGLPLSKTLVEAHQGHLWLESDEGKGTSVFVRLPPSRVIQQVYA